MVKKVLAAFPHVAVVLNTGGMMDTLWFRDNPAVGAALLAWQGGMEGGLAAADILVGDVPAGPSDGYVRVVVCGLSVFGEFRGIQAVCGVSGGCVRRLSLL